MRRPVHLAAIHAVVAVAAALSVAVMNLPAQAGTRPPAASNPAAVAAPAAATEAAATLPAAAAELTGDIVFSVPSGTFQGELSVSLSTAISGAQIRYTTDGRPPDAGSPAYNGTPLRFAATTQLRVQAFVGGVASGAPGTALYVARSFNATHDLPLIVIDDYGRGRPGRDYVDAATLIFDTSGGSTSLAATPAVATRTGMKLRGGSSASFEKTPYRLEFRDNDDDDADYPVLGMPEDSDWVLRGPYPDKALIREPLVYSLGQAMGLPTPRYAFVEFYLNTDGGALSNSDYMGVYLIEETIKNSKNRLDLKQLDEDDTTLPKITGGYIFKFEWLNAEEPTLTCTGSAATCWNYLEVADPDPLVPEQKAWLTQYLQQFHDMLHSSSYADPQTGYPAYIDVDSWIDQLIIYELSRNMDAYVRSAYFYKDRDGKIFAGPLWDYDASFGVGGYFNNTQTSGWQYQQTRQPLANDWFTILLRDPAFVNRVKIRWQQLRQGELSNTTLNARIDALAAPLANAAARNFQRWPNLTTSMVGGFFTPTASTWQGQVQAMRDWLLQRAAWLDSTSGWGGSTTPTSSPTTSPTTTPSTSPTSPPPGGGGCMAAYTIVNQWSGGFQAEVRVVAGSSAITGWTVTWTLASGQSVTQVWNATLTTSGSAVTARNLSYNGSLAPSASTTFGLLGSGNSGSPPTLTCSAT